MIAVNRTMHPWRLKPLPGHRTAQNGSVFIMTIVLVLVGCLIVPPLLSYANSALNTCETYEERTNMLYAADSGIEDALWQIQYGDLESLLTAPSAYDPFDYETTWTYDVSESINGHPVSVSVENVWIPNNISPPSPTEAQSVIEDGRLIVTGNIIDIGTYEVQLTYYPEEGEDLRVTSVGIWLPVGFSYVAGSSNLEEVTSPPNEYYSVPTVSEHAGGHAVVWGFASLPFENLPAVDPGGSPLVSRITFQFDSVDPTKNPAVMSWITTSGVSGLEVSWDADSKVFKIEAGAGTARAEAYITKSELREMGSTIGGDYAAVGNGLLGGNETYHNYLYEKSSTSVDTDDADPGCDVDEVPSDASIQKAYLYWSGWIDWHEYDDTGGAGWDTILFEDDCADFSYWDGDSSADWVINSGRFRGHHNGSESDRYLTMTTGVDLSGRSPGEVTVSWEQYAPSYYVDSSDCLYYYFFDSSGNWDGPFTAFCDEDPSSSFSTVINDAQYLHSEFKIKFYLNYFGGSYEYCEIDNITIGVGDCMSLKYPDDPSAANLERLVEECAKVNRIMFAPGPTHSGTQVSVDYQDRNIRLEPTLGSAWADTWSYACRADVTDIINQWINDGDLESNGAGQYSVGHVIEANQAKPGYSIPFYTGGSTGYPLAYPARWLGYPGEDTRYHYCYGGWSLVLIYSSGQTAGHQLYLYDDVFTEAWGPSDPSGYDDPDFDEDGEDGGIISGFLVPEDIEEDPARITAFVVEGDRDISGDTFRVNWQSLTSDHSSYSDNVWDSDWVSGAHSVPGVDIDTFSIDSSIVGPGDTQAQVNLSTQSDGFILVYLILSFRSDVVTGGAIHYLLEP